MTSKEKKDAQVLDHISELIHSTFTNRNSDEKQMLIDYAIKHYKYEQNLGTAGLIQKNDTSTVPLC